MDLTHPDCLNSNIRLFSIKRFRIQKYTQKIIPVKIRATMDPMDPNLDFQYFKRTKAAIDIFYKNYA